MRSNSLILGAALTLALLAGCGSSETSEANQKGCDGALIGDSIPQGSDPSLKMVHDGLSKEAKLRGAKVHSADADLDVNKQVSDVDNFIQRQVDAITVWPMDTTAIRPALQRAKDDDILVVTQQTPKGVDFSTNLQFDDRGAGVALATYLSEKSEPGAKVAAIVGPQEVDSFRNLAEGFAEGAKVAGLDVVETKSNAELSPEKSAEITQELKSRYGADLAGIFDTINVTALATATVVGNGFEPLIVTYEANKETRAAIEDGRLAATAFVPDVLVGRSKAWAACQRLEGKELPNKIESPYIIADTDNIKAIPTEDEQLSAKLSFNLKSHGATGHQLTYGGIDLPDSAVENPSTN